MTLLLDTHAFLWSLLEPRRLGERAQNAIADRSNTVFVSIASAWEIAIKHGLGKLHLPLPPQDLVPTRIKRAGFEVLQIRLDHALAVGDLPAHHSDPFDRMLIAQGTVDSLTIVTADRAFGAYDVDVWMLNGN